MFVALGGRLWEPSVDRRGTYGREPSFRNAVSALVISVRIGTDMSDKLNIPLSNIRSAQMVLQIDQIDGGAWAGNGEGNKDRPSPGAVCRDSNRALLLEEKAVTYEN